MTSKEITIENKAVLYARSATLFVQEAARYCCDIHISKEERRANTKSLLGVLSLGISKGDTIILTASGVDEETALGALSSLLRSNYAEKNHAECARNFA